MSGIRQLSLTWGFSSVLPVAQTTNQLRVAQVGGNGSGIWEAMGLAGVKGRSNGQGGCGKGETVYTRQGGGG